jgi:hypothetical protein
MRYFRSTPETFDAFREVIAGMLGLPSARAEQSWDAGITHLALSPHEYNDPTFAPMIEQAIADDQVEEIDEATYRAETQINASDIIDTSAPTEE